MNKLIIFILLITFSLQQETSLTNLENKTNGNDTTNIINLTNINNVISTNNSFEIKISSEAINLTKTTNFNETTNLTNEDNNIEDNNNTLNNNSKEKIEEKNESNTENVQNKNDIKFKGLKHYENCNKTSDCRKGLKCYFNRCLTNYEKENYVKLGLNVSNVCNTSKECLLGKKCLKHRCVVNSTQLDIPRKKTINDTSVNLLFAGSIFLNNKAYKSGEKDDNNFNYNHLFKNIKEDIKKADLAIVDQETVFQTNKTKFKKKVANTPTELGDAIVKAGFRLVLHGTIYAYSKEDKGIKNTIKFWKDKYPDVHVLGISKTLKNSLKDYYIYKKRGIKIGIVNFSGFPDLIPKEKEYMVNVISTKKIEYFMTKLKNETDFIIACMNWGDKNSNIPNEDQIKWAKELTGKGANLIIGNHPSYVQPVSYIRSKGRKALVFWSLGHLVSDSKLPYSFIGALANITISKGKKGKAFISDYNLIPIINHKDKKAYSVYKLSKYSQELGKEISKDFSMEEVKNKSKKLMEAFFK